MEIGVGRHIKRTKRMNLKNLSFDRLDNSKPYNVDNIIFCCQNCNVSKNNVSIKLIKRLHEVITERNL
jgi:5-methylcytosine-specific restriction endonuclease McrA